MKRFIFVTRRLLTVAVAITVLAQAAVLRAQSPTTKTNDPPADTCILQIVAHAKAAVSVDGRDYGSKREFTFSPLTPGQEYQSVVSVRLPDGRKDQKKVPFVAGKVVRVSVGPSLVESFEFRDQYSPPPNRVEGTLLKEMTYSTKPWTADKKQIVREWLQMVEQKAPYLLARATAYRPVRVYFSRDSGLRAAEVWVDNHALIVFDRAFADSAETKSFGAFILTHELTHLADCPRLISSRQDWEDLARPRIDRVWKAFQAQTGRDAADYWSTAKDVQAQKSDEALMTKLAKAEGLPGGYATYAVFETLAECTAWQAWKLNEPPAEIQAFVDANLLSPTGATMLSVERCFDAIYAAEKDYLAGALQSLDAAIAADSSQAWAYLLRGKAREANKQRDAALQDYTEAVRLNPRLHEAHGARGKLLVSMSRHDEAVAELTKALESFPQETTYLLERATAYRGLTKRDAAIADYGAVIRRKPGAVGATYQRGDLYLQTSRYPQALADFSEVIKYFASSPELKAIFGEAYVKRGQAYVGLDQYDNAVTDFSAALEISPNYLPAKLMRGEAYRLAKKYDEAVADYSQVIEKAPNYAYPYYVRALTWDGKNQPDKALADLNAAIEHDPKYVRAYIDRARLRFRQKDHTAAIVDLDEAIKIAPQDPQAYYVRAVVRSSMKDYDLSIEDYTMVIELAPRDHESVYLRGEVYAEKHDYDRAIADYTKVLEASPQHFDAMRRRGDAYFSKSDYSRALQDFTAALKLKEEHAGVHHMRGRALQALHRPDEAIAEYSRAIEINPKYTWPHWYRAQVRSERGEYQLAIQDHEAAIKIDPKLHSSYVSLTWIYATAPDAAIRNGQKAIEYGTTACEQSEWKDANDLCNLACAYAEAGKFEEAVKWQTKANEMYSPEMKEKWGFLLELFKSGKTYHEEPTRAGAM